jgi:hypothetical protein
MHYYKTYPLSTMHVHLIEMSGLDLTKTTTPSLHTLSRGY